MPQLIFLPIKGMIIMYIQYHDCWWHAAARIQGISRYSIDLFLLEHYLLVCICVTQLVLRSDCYRNKLGQYYVPLHWQAIGYNYFDRISSHFPYVFSYFHFSTVMKMQWIPPPPPPPPHTHTHTQTHTRTHQRNKRNKSACMGLILQGQHFPKTT